MPHATSSGGTPAPTSHAPILLNQILEAARVVISPDVRQRAPRYGRIGACVACLQPIHAHFDAAGGFLGCAAATEDTVFVLVPISETGRVVSTEPAPRVRQFRRARYVPSVANHQVDALNLTDRQRKVLQPVIDAGKKGIRARDVEKRSGLTHSSVSQALYWLRRSGLIDAQDDSDDT